MKSRYTREAEVQKVPKSFATVCIKFKKKKKKCNVGLYQNESTCDNFAALRGLCSKSIGQVDYSLPLLIYWSGKILIRQSPETPGGCGRAAI